MRWHTLETGAVCEALAVDPALGLETAEAARRLAVQGPNELTDSGGVSPWRILWEQCSSTMALILAGAAVVSLAIGSYRDAAAILAIVCLFATLGFVQEYRAERAMRALKRMSQPTVRVRRSGSASVT